MKALSDTGKSTAQRIIDAAGAVFGERGFRATTIRQITTRAGVNVAAVNYHFKNKSELYHRVLREAKKHVALLGIDEFPGSPKEQLGAFVERFVHYLLDPKRPVWHARVLAMEMSNPTPVLGVILRELTAPLYQNIRSLIGKIVDGKASSTELDLLANSLIGQCVFYANCRPVTEQLSVHLTRAPGRTQRIAQHITLFSLAALNQYGGRGAVQSARATQTSRRHLALT